MQLVDYKVDVKGVNDGVSVWGIGDIHVGSRACDEKLLHSIVSRVKKNKKARVVLMGDLIEAINPTDKRFDATNLPDWVEFKDLDNLAIIQCNRVVDMLLPIADKIICSVAGNHEATAHRRYHFDPHDYILTRLRDKAKVMIHNGGYGQCILRLKTKRGSHTTTTMFSLFHGSGGGVTLGGTINKQVKTLDYIECDVKMSGHTHQLTEALVPRCYVPSSGKLDLISKPKVIVQTGSYLKTYGDDFTTYSEMREYAPVPLGSPEVIITGDVPKMQVILHTG